MPARLTKILLIGLLAAFSVFVSEIGTVQASGDAGKASGAKAGDAKPKKKEKVKLSQRRF